MKLKIEKAPFGAATPKEAEQINEINFYSAIVAQTEVFENGILRKRRETDCLLYTSRCV